MSSRSRSRCGALSGLSIALLAILSLASASTALAGPPVHNRVPALDLSGFDHACGTAVDSQGDVYVSSAGESKVRIFDSGHAELTAIPIPGEPCGLAVDTNGNLYVVKKATKEVVKCEPSAYPPTGATTYACATIPGIGNAGGIAVDPFDNRFYVSEGNRISAYDSTGRLGIDEVQRILPFLATGGTFTLSFEGQTTPEELKFDASHEEVEKALEALSTIGADNVSVTEGSNGPTDHIIHFEGPLGHADLASITADSSKLVGGTVLIAEPVKGFSGHIGEGSLTSATGVAAYTNKITNEKADRYLFVADDAASDEVKIFSGPDIRSLKPGVPIKGPKAGEDFGFGAAGAYLAVDRGNRDAGDKCASVLKQACTAGHLLVYDDAHSTVDEFEAGGVFIDQFGDPALTDAQPTAMAIDRSGGANDGTIYLSTGAGPGAKLLAFEALKAPDRPLLPELSQEKLPGAQAVATDSHGDVYVAASPLIKVYGPDGKVIPVGPEGKGIPVSQLVYDLAVDSTGKVYAQVNFNSGNRATEKVQYYTPSSYPPKAGTTYGGPVTVADGNSFLNSNPPLTRIGLNPANDHVFAINQDQAIELGAAAEGSEIINDCFACGLGSGGQLNDIAAYGANGNVYIAEGFGVIDVFEASGKERVARISGGGSPQGPFSGPPARTIAVDQSNGHVLVFMPDQRGVAEEYDATGAFVAEFGSFPNGSETPGIAIDNGALSPNQGNVYAADDEPTPGSPDVWAFGPLSYSERPVTVTGIADGLGGGGATLHGTVNPSGFELSECKFEYLSADKYEHNKKTLEVAPFTGASSQACAESLATIGDGKEAVPVHADLSGLEPEVHYRFRLVARNEYGPGKEDEATFGPVLASTEEAQSVLRSEATLRASVDPLGLGTSYRFEYGTVAGVYDQSTPPGELAPGGDAVAVQAPVTGLAPDTEYHFRVLAENEASSGPVAGSEESFKTLPAAESPPDCPNAEYRSGPSAGLPDCRAYELLTPADTRGAIPIAAGSSTPGKIFNNWLTPPRGPLAGERVAYFIPGTLPGFEGTGSRDGYRAQRAPGEHPAAGWSTALFGPTYTQGGGSQNGVAADQDYSLWTLGGAEGGLAAGSYLRTPSGFEPLAQGSLAPNLDLQAEGRFLSPQGTHVVFSSKAHLEEAAAPQGTEAIYDRAAGAASAEVVSVRPDGSGFGAGENASYVGASEDGAAILFRQSEVQKIQVNATGGSFKLNFEGKETSSIPYNAEAAVVQEELQKLTAISGNVRLVEGPTGETGPALKAYVVLFVGPLANRNNPELGCAGSLTGGTATCTVKTEVEGTLYRHRAGQTTAIAVAPFEYAGISEDGARIFYSDSSSQDGFNNPLPADLFVCDVQAGPCVGPEPSGRMAIAPDSLFVNVSSDGSRVLFTSKEDLDGAGEGVKDEDNLYLWDGAETRFVASLDPEDLKGFIGDTGTNLRRWTTALSAGTNIGRAASPTRSTPDGAFFVFQSHAQLTAYDNGGHSEIYRYDPAAAGGAQILCVSCDPSGAPAVGEAVLQSTGVISGVNPVTTKQTMISNLTDDGGRILFESTDRLLPEDANDVRDVYEWKANDIGGCEEPGGCLALISAGQGEDPSFLYGMTADPQAHDVFFETRQKLLGTDLAGSPSLYDARVEGGIPAPPEKEPCHGDACQGPGSAAPALGSPSSNGSGEGNLRKKGCPKGKHRVKGRCVARHAKKRHGKAHHKRSPRGAKGNRRPSR